MVDHKCLGSGPATRLGDRLVLDQNLQEDQSPGVGCYLMAVGSMAFVGLHITQQPEDTLFRKVPGLSQSATGGPLDLRSRLC